MSHILNMSMGVQLLLSQLATIVGLVLTWVLVRQAKDRE